MSDPNGVFAIAPGVPFAAEFAAGFFQRFKHTPPADVARIQIWVNSSLAGQSLEEALADAAPHAGVLPRIARIPDLQSDPLLAPDAPRAISPIRRQLRLTKLVEQFLKANHQAGERLGTGRMAADLADELAALIDLFHDEGVAAESLDGILANQDLLSEAARHWELTLRFVDIVRKLWPEILREELGGATDTRARQRLAIQDLLAKWQSRPPTNPVIAAASTGSVGSTADFLAAVAALPSGAVVLPGIDPATPDEIWEHAGPDHPLGPFKGVMSRTGLTPADLKLWADKPPRPVAQLLTQALRPAPVTDHWHEAAEDLATLVDQSAAGLTVLEARDPAEEANAIALAIRETVEDPASTVALITSDASLARRVTASLGRYDIRPDDTMGQPLLLSPPGVLFRLAADCADDPADAVRLAALLGHPLIRPGQPRPQHLARARRYEREILRQPAASSINHLPPWPGADAEDQAWLATISAALAELAQVRRSALTFAETLSVHIDAVERLTTENPDAKPAIWDGEAGNSLSESLARVLRDADAYGTEPPPDYAALMTSLLAGEQLRPLPREPHPRVVISGPREARLISADLVILAGLEEGTWPTIPDPGPWLSRQMYEALGLPPPERSVGLSAHDFLHAASGSKVILSRSAKKDGAATVASRWLIRLETLVRGVGRSADWEGMVARGRRLCDSARAQSMPRQEVPRAERPRPYPPQNARPRKLSVTALETLVRDAYAIYARDILRLRALEPLGRPPDARDRGIVLHRILEAFVDQDHTGLTAEAARDLLLKIAEEKLADDVPWPDLRRAWRARIARAAHWFVTGEAERRSRGEPVGLETSGALVLRLPQGPFTLTATADRIDRGHGGGGLIYDYKTGAPPAPKQIEAGFNHQIHVQAAMLAEGGFARLSALEPQAGAYLGLTGAGEGGKSTEINDLPEELGRHMSQVRDLLTSFDNGAPYVSYRRPVSTSFTSDYDHLARKAEWWDGGDI